MIKFDSQIIWAILKGIFGLETKVKEKKEKKLR